jgi:hypothetical protein
MTSNNQNALQLVTEVQQKELLVNLILQLNKDFAMVGLDFNLSKDSDPSMVVKYLDGYLLELIKKDFNSYVNLLYRIGIPEKEVKAIDDMDIEVISKKVAILILRKEWQKVFFRSKNL